MKHKNKTIWIVTLLVLFSITSTCFADGWWDGEDQDPTDTIETTKNEEGRVTEASRTNWQEGYLEVMAGATANSKQSISQAHAYAIALKTARHLAYEKLAETVSGLHLSSSATYDRELLCDSNLKTEMRAIIRNARVIKEENQEFKDDSIWVEVTLGLYLYGDNGIIQPSISWQKKSLSTTEHKHTPLPETMSVFSPLQPKKPFTGLIVDASGLYAKPAMFPQLIAENGTVLYSGQDVSPEYIKRIGLIGYQNSLAKAMRLERVGSNPLVIRAKATSGLYHADYILADDDVSLITSADMKNNFLKQCRVAAVVSR